MKFFKNRTNTEKLLDEFSWLWAVKDCWSSDDRLKVYEALKETMFDTISSSGGEAQLWARYQGDIGNSREVKVVNIAELGKNEKWNFSKMTIGMAIKKAQPQRLYPTHFVWVLNATHVIYRAKNLASLVNDFAESFKKFQKVQA